MQILRMTILIGLMLALPGLARPQADGATKAWKPSLPAKSRDLYPARRPDRGSQKPEDSIFRTALSLGRQ